MKVALYLFNCPLFNSFRVHQHLNARSKTLRFHDSLLNICDALLKDDLLDTEIVEIITTLRASHRDSTTCFPAS
jgi:hypothetical protein